GGAPPARRLPRPLAGPPRLPVSVPRSPAGGARMRSTMQRRVHAFAHPPQHPACPPSTGIPMGGQSSVRISGARLEAPAAELPAGAAHSKFVNVVREAEAPEHAG